MPLINITIPVFNEERQLEDSVERILRHISRYGQYDWEIVIADNGSTDGTREKALRLAAREPRIGVTLLDQKGRGRALKGAWTRSEASVLSYMDVDLSTDLSHLGPLVDGIVYGGYDIVVGSRLCPGAKVKRGLRREFVSRSYNRLIQAMFSVRFTDAQCGFKAISRNAALFLLPQIINHRWFFDTELLLLAEYYSFTVMDIPVIWNDDPGSTVHLASTIAEDLSGLLRMKRTFARGNLNRYRRCEVAGKSHAHG